MLTWVLYYSFVGQCVNPPKIKPVRRCLNHLPIVHYIDASMQLSTIACIIHTRVAWSFYLKRRIAQFLGSILITGYTVHCNMDMELYRYNVSRHVHIPSPTSTNLHTAKSRNFAGRFISRTIRLHSKGTMLAKPLFWCWISNAMATPRVTWVCWGIIPTKQRI